MRASIALLLLLTAGCAGYDVPRPEDFERLKLGSTPTPPGSLRLRVHLSLDSRWLAGEFDGVVIGQSEPVPVARIQLFGDLGPKMIDVLARPELILGYFPQNREGIGAVLPDQATPHPLLFLGVTVLEDLARVGEERVLGIREEDDGWWLNLKPLVPGMRVELRRDANGRTLERRFKWMYGVGWTERWSSPQECRISASGVEIHVRLLESEPLDQPPSTAFKLTVPSDVRMSGARR
ncbi:MAG: hypothetical protein JO332_14015 [Planctomycetaceae bacterium]|nr:hypothetical protein [Planctomycetaceae bacterium]